MENARRLLCDYIPQRAGFSVPGLAGGKGGFAMKLTAHYVENGGTLPDEIIILDRSLRVVARASVPESLEKADQQKGKRDEKETN